MDTLIFLFTVLSHTSLIPRLVDVGIEPAPAMTQHGMLEPTPWSKQIMSDIDNNDDSLIHDFDHERAEAMLEETYNTDAAPGYWGYYSFSDAPAGMCGGGMGGFTWFRDQESLLTFFEGALPHIASTWLDYDALAAPFAEFGEHLRADWDSLNDVLLDANNLLKGWEQILWMGSFEELTSGESAFACELRAWFREFIFDEDIDGDMPATFSSEPLPEELWEHFSQEMYNRGL